MARYNEDEGYEEGDYDFDGNSFTNDEYDDGYAVVWKKTHVNISWKNPLTWVMWLFATIWNGLKWSFFTWFAHILTYANEASMWTFVRKIGLEAICAGTALALGLWFPAGELRGWLYMPLQVVMIGFGIDIIAIFIMTALRRFGGGVR